MKLFICLVIFALVGVSVCLADSCDGYFYLNDTNTSFSCDSTGSATYNITLSKPAYVTVQLHAAGDSDFLFFGPNSSVPIPGEPRLLALQQGSGKSHKFVVPSGTTIGQSALSYSGYNEAVSISLSEPDFTFHNLFPGVPTTVTEYQSGGYVYFKMENMYLGGAWSFQLCVNQYNGLRTPNLLVSFNDIPTLENFQWNNQSTMTGNGRYEAVVSGNGNDAQDGSYYIAAFLYGSFGNVTIHPVWKYSQDRVTFIEPLLVYNGSASFINKQFYGIHVPKDTNTMVVQFSRQIPGGFPNLFIRPGQLPLTDSTEDAADGTYVKRLITTEKDSYFSIKIDDPNPSISNGEYLNADYWYFAVNNYAEKAADSGYLLEVYFQ